MHKSKPQTRREGFKISGAQIGEWQRKSMTVEKARQAQFSRESGTH